MTETKVKEGFEYTVSNYRLRYTPELHFNHQKSWTRKDLRYLCGMWGCISARSISMALGRTENVCMTMIHKLKKAGEFTGYKQEYRNS